MKCDGLLSKSARLHRCASTAGLPIVLNAIGGATDIVGHRRRVSTRNWHSENCIVDKFIRFVARDSRGQCFLWSMRWGEAGYGCRIATLTELEERALHKWSSPTATKTRGLPPRPDPPCIADQTPVSGSFVSSGNALRFFSKNGDPELERWARIMFHEVQDSDAPA